jgi:thymidylate kinase
LDAGGKGTQVKLIKEYFEKQGKKVRHIHFPKYGYSDFSEMIAKFLRGEYGDNDKVDPGFDVDAYILNTFNKRNAFVYNRDRGPLSRAELIAARRTSGAVA